jgi:multifunctional beta-oxidation protein
MTEDMVQAMKPEWNAPFVVALCSDSISPPPTGLIFELGLGWMANTRLQRSTSFDFSEDQGLTPERVLDAWPQLLESSRNREGEGRSKL